MKLISTSPGLSCKSGLITSIAKPVQPVGSMKTNGKEFEPPFFTKSTISVTASSSSKFSGRISASVTPSANSFKRLNASGSFSRNKHRSNTVLLFEACVSRAVRSSFNAIENELSFNSLERTFQGPEKQSTYVRVDQREPMMCANLWRYFWRIRCFTSVCSRPM